MMRVNSVPPPAKIILFFIDAFPNDFNLLKGSSKNIVYMN